MLGPRWSPWQRGDAPFPDSGSVFPVRRPGHCLYSSFSSVSAPPCEVLPALGELNGVCVSRLFCSRAAPRAHDSTGRR